jgi:DNA primase
MIPEETIARVRESVDLVELIRESVPGVKKRGRNFQARCPFHQERTPSFNVNPEMGVFKCFGCGVGGDAFKYVMLTEGLSYPEAIKKLATRVGIVIEENAGSGLTEEAREREKIYQVLEESARFYHRYLMEAAEAQAARDYLAKRGVTSDTIERFSIGYAPASGHGLRDAAVKKEWTPELLERAGLLRRREGRAGTFDHFWSRIIFPIWDVQGRVIAFGGRAMGDAMPKYINSPETPVYSKSRHLYGLFQGLATIRKRRQVVVLEGYMDVAVCHQFGFDLAVATLGTALTEEHVRVLRRYTDRVTLLFDPDAAGAQATLRGGELLLAEGMTVDVVVLPDARDADEILVQNGVAALEQCFAQSEPFIDYLVKASLQRFPEASPESKLAVAQQVLPVIRKMKDPLLQDEYVGRLASRLRVEKAVLGQQMKRLKGERVAKDAAVPAALPPEGPSKAIRTLEEEMILLSMLFPSEWVARTLDTIAWREPASQEIWTLLRDQVAQGKQEVGEFLPKLSEPAQQRITRLAVEDRRYPDPARKLLEMVEGWQRQADAERLQTLKHEIDLMIEGQILSDPKKIQTYNDLSRRLKGSRTSREAPLHG